MKLASAFAVLIFLTIPVQAEFMGGNKLHEFCSAGTPGRDGVVTGFAMGSFDAFASLPASQQGYCLPTGANARQLRDVVCGHLVRHPETRHHPAAFLTQQAFAEAWPCPAR